MATLMDSSPLEQFRHPPPSQPLTDKQTIFVDNLGVPIPIFVEAAGVQRRPRLVRELKAAGANISFTPQDARVILVEPETKEGKQFVRDWGFDPGKVVLQTSWVRICFERNAAQLVDEDWAGCRLVDDGRPIEDEEDEEEVEAATTSNRPRATANQTHTSNGGASTLRRRLNQTTVSSNRNSDTQEPVRASSGDTKENTSYPLDSPSSHGHYSSQQHFSDSPFIPSGQMPMPAYNAPPPQPMVPMQSPQSFSLGQFNPSQPHFPQMDPAVFAQVTQQNPAHFSFAQLADPNMQSVLLNLIAHMQAQSQQQQHHLMSQQALQSPQSWPVIHSAATQITSSPTHSAYPPQSSTGSSGQSVSQQLQNQTESQPSSSNLSFPDDTFPPHRKGSGSFQQSQHLPSWKGKTRDRTRSFDTFDERSISHSSKRHRGSPPTSQEAPASSLPRPNSKAHGMFAPHDRALLFHVQIEIRDRQELLKIIRNNGGKICTEMGQADYIILNSASKSFESLRQEARSHGIIPLRSSFLYACRDARVIVATDDYVLDEPARTRGSGQRGRRPMLNVASGSPPKRRKNGSTGPSEGTPTPSVHGAEGGSRDSESPEPPKNPRMFENGRYSFTPEENAYLMEYCRLLMKRDPNISWGAIARAMHAKLSHHTMNSWASYIDRMRPSLNMIKEEALVGSQITVDSSVSRMASPAVAGHQTTVSTANQHNTVPLVGSKPLQTSRDPAQEDLDAIIHFFASGQGDDEDEAAVWTAMDRVRSCRTASSWREFYAERSEEIKEGVTALRENIGVVNLEDHEASNGPPEIKAET